MTACGERLMHYRDMGVIVAGGAVPLVDRRAWDMLKPKERAEIFDIGACMASAGRVEEKFVTVKSADLGNPEIETLRIANDRDFQKEAGSSE